MNRSKLYLIGGIAAAVLIAVIVFLCIYLGIQKTSSDAARAEMQNQIEQLRIDSANMAMASQLNELNLQYQQHENEAIKLENDTILAKYNASKARIEELISELNSQKKKSREEINRLQKEIESLRGILRHYIAMVDSLSKENSELRTEISVVRDRNQQLASNLSQVSRENEHLNERVTLAEKLNVSDVRLTPLNKKGKTEKNVTKAKQLMVTFNIPQNNTTPVGQKTIYLRLTGPEGALLGASGRFSFEGASIPFTEAKTIEYSGDEIPGVTIYWNVDTTLNPGEYTVELFCDNFRLTSRHFTLKK